MNIFRLGYRLSTNIETKLTCRLSSYSYIVFIFAALPTQSRFSQILNKISRCTRFHEHITLYRINTAVVRLWDRFTTEAISRVVQFQLTNTGDIVYLIESNKLVFFLCHSPITLIQHSHNQIILIRPWWRGFRYLLDLRESLEWQSAMHAKHPGVSTSVTARPVSVSPPITWSLVSRDISPGRVFPVVTQWPLGVWPLARGLASSRTVDPPCLIPDPHADAGCAEQSRASLSTPNHHADLGGFRVGTGEHPDFDGIWTTWGGVGAKHFGSGHLLAWRPAATASHAPTTDSYLSDQ